MYNLPLLLQAIRQKEVVIPHLYRKFGVIKNEIALGHSSDLRGSGFSISKEEDLEINQEYNRIKIEALSAALRAQILIFSRWRSFDETKSSNDSSITSLPFESVWIEVRDGFIDDTIAGLLVYETDPGVIKGFALNIKDRSKPMAIYQTFDAELIGDLYTSRNIESNLWQLSRTGLAGKITCKEKIKIGKIRDSENEVKKISSIIYIRDKVEKDVLVTFQGREIDYSHRFMVRGHWRKFSGIGKNRSGERVVQGHTWVTEHEKGPEDAPMVPKIRIVGPESIDAVPNH